MANHKLLFGHVIKWEGGLGADPYDTALKNCGHSGLKGDPRWPDKFVHTSHGVTWCTWNEYHKAKGLKADAARFVQMPKDVWQDIFKTLFWDQIFGDYISSQAIAENFFDAIWGSGPGGASSTVKAVQRFLLDKGWLLDDDGTMGMETVKAINAYARTKAKELEIVNVQLNARRAYYADLKNRGYARFYDGWMNRLNDLYARSKEIISMEGAGALVGLALFGGIGIAVYWWLSSK